MKGLSERPLRKRGFSDWRIFFAESNVKLDKGKKIQAKKVFCDQDVCFFCSCTAGHGDADCYEFDVGNVKLKGYCFLDKSSTCKERNVIELKRIGKSLAYLVVDVINGAKICKRSILLMNEQLVHTQKCHSFINPSTWKKLQDAQRQVLCEVSTLQRITGRKCVKIPNGFKRCSGECQRALKLCSAFFRVDSCSNTGFRSQCKQCSRGKKRKIIIKLKRNDIVYYIYYYKSILFQSFHCRF